MKCKIEGDSWEYPSQNTEEDVTESEYSRADFHPFSESAKDAADDGCSVFFLMMTI